MESKIKLYDCIDSKPLEGNDFVYSRNEHNVYIDQNDKIICYLGNRVEIDSKFIINKNYNVVTLNRGCLLLDKNINSNDNYFSKEIYKKIDCDIILPGIYNNAYGIENIRNIDKNRVNEHNDYKDYIEEYIFGIKCCDLDLVLDTIYKINASDRQMELNDSYHFGRYPRITRSIKKDNKCGLTGLLIPKGFPYIAFDENGEELAYISLWGFIRFIKLILKITITEKNIEFLKSVEHIKLFQNLASYTDYFSGIPIYYSEYFDYIPKNRV